MKSKLTWINQDYKYIIYLEICDEIYAVITTNFLSVQFLQIHSPSGS